MILYLIALMIVTIAGFMLIPTASYLIRDGVPAGLAELLAYGHLCLAHFAWGGSALVQHPYGYELHPLRVSEGDAGPVVEVFDSSDWVEIDAGPADLDRFAFGWFALLLDRDNLRPYEAPKRGLATDGGDGQLDEVRQDYRAFDPTVQDGSVAAAGGPKVDLTIVSERLLGANAEGLAAAGKEKALLEHGSIIQGGVRATTIGFIVCLVLGAALMYLGSGGAA